MQGFPQTIATREDIINLLADADYHDRMILWLQRVLDERYCWVLLGQLDPVGTDTAEPGHKIVPIHDAAGVVVQRYLYQWAVAPNAALDRLGVSVDEAVTWGAVDKAIPAPSAEQ